MRLTKFHLLQYTHITQDASHYLSYICLKAYDVVTAKQPLGSQKTRTKGQKYSFLLRNEENFHEKVAFRAKIEHLRLFILGAVLLIVLITALSTYYIDAYIDKHFSSQAQLNRKIFQLTSFTDSLSAQLLYNKQYIQSIQALFSVDTGYLKQPIPLIDPQDQTLTQSFFANPRQSTHSTPIIPTSAPDILTYDPAPDHLTYTYLFPPVKGYLSDRFSFREEHFGIDIVAPEGETIYAVQEGTVIFASWTEDGGYIIAIMHPNHLFSIYKHNATLLKNMGDKVYTGQPIAIIGNTGTLSFGTHLHFELWYAGRVLNPELFINFN